MSECAVMVNPGSYASQAQLLQLMSFVVLESVGSYYGELQEIKERFGWKSVLEVSRFSPPFPSPWNYYVYARDKSTGQVNSAAASILGVPAPFVVKGEIIIVKVFTLREHRQSAYRMDLADLAYAIFNAAAIIARQEIATPQNSGAYYQAEEERWFSELAVYFSIQDNGDYNAVSPYLDSLERQLLHSDYVVTSLTPMFKHMIPQEAKRYGSLEKFGPERDWSLVGMTKMLKRLRLEAAEGKEGVPDGLESMFRKCRAITARAKAIRAADSLEALRVRMERQSELWVAEDRADSTRWESTGEIKRLEFWRSATGEMSGEASVPAGGKKQTAKQKLDLSQAAMEAEKLTEQQAEDASRAEETSEFCFELPLDYEMEDWPLESGWQHVAMHNISPEAWSLEWCWGHMFDCWARFKQAYKRPARLPRGGQPRT